MVPWFSLVVTFCLHHLYDSCLSGSLSYMCYLHTLRWQNGKHEMQIIIIKKSEERRKEHLCLIIWYKQWFLQRHTASFSYLCFHEQKELRSPRLSGLLGSEFLGNRRKSGRLDLSHSIKTVALKLTARSAEEPNSLYWFTIRIYIHTHTQD